MNDYKIRFLRPENRESKKITEERVEDVLNSGYTVNSLITYWVARLHQFFNETLGFPIENMRYRELITGEKAFYSKVHWDFELFSDDLGWVELANNAYRTDHDLSGHEKQSGEKMEVFDVDKNIKPYMYEPSIGVDRAIIHYLLIFYREYEKRHWFAFPKQIAPYLAGVFPLIKKDGLSEKAESIFESLKKEFDAFYDESGSIGKRYARADEIGVPYCITIDHQTLEDGTVTVRKRDTTEQVRLAIDELPNYLKKN
jgi:glycyl-tRNA synthetase